MHWLLRARSLQVITCRTCSVCRSFVSHATQNVSKPRQSSYFRLISSKDVSYSQFRRFASSSSSTTVGGPTITRKQHTVSPKLKTRYARREYLQGGNDIVTVSQLAHHIDIDEGKLIDILDDMGENIRSPNCAVAPEVAEFMCMEFNKPTLAETRQSESLVTRPPVVTIMGHVDHGKTTLLDALRNSSIAAGEAGGITQHIGAFLVTLPSGEEITFIDTPGHAAFESMRARGANVTDIVVLVVAADDGVKTQTVESIRHAVHANVPIIVAINKIDKGRKNVDLLKRQLLSHGIQLEEYGGDVQVVEISALKRTNLDSLTEAIITLAEMNDLQADTDTNIEGVVIEAKKDKGLGPVVTALVQNGTLKIGDIIVAGSTFAKVRQMYTDRGTIVSTAPPSTPVQVTGWKDLPAAGEKLHQVDTEKKANELALSRRSYDDQKRKETLSQSFDLSEIIKDDGRRIKISKGEYDAANKIDVVVKGDVDGSVEAVVDALNTCKSDKIKLSVLHAGVGSVSEYDIKTAHSFKGVVLGFNIKISKEIQQLARQMDVEIKNHTVIYKLLADLKNEMSSRLPPVREETSVGEAEILKVFRFTGSKKACVAGCRVKQGVLNKDCRYRIVRRDNTIHEGKLSTLKRGSDNVDVVKKEQECGLSFEKFSGFKEADRVECYQINMKQDEVDWEWGF